MVSMHVRVPKEKNMNIILPDIKLQNQFSKCVEQINKQKKIYEDNLRILRFFRFYTYYCFEMNYFDLQNCIKYKDEIKTLSKERISEEFYKILQSPYSIKVLSIMQNCGILQEILNINKKLNFDNLYIFYSINQFIDFEYNYLFILCLILSKNKFDLNLLLINKNKKLLRFIIVATFYFYCLDNCYLL